MLGWSTEGPPRRQTRPPTGWLSVPQANGTHEGLGQDSASDKIKESILEIGLGKDEAVSALKALYGRDAGLGEDVPSFYIPRFEVEDEALGQDYSPLGIAAVEEAIGLDLASIKSSQTVPDLASALDAISTFRAVESALEAAAGLDYATAGFKPPAGVPITNQYTVNWSLTIPVWCKYIDIIILAGGGGGAGGNSWGADGKGGQAGGWNYAILTRGGNILWTDKTITGTIGAGGTSGSRGNGSGGKGGDSTAVIPQIGTISALGGTGGSGTNGVGAVDYYGKAPDVLEVNDIYYQGGATQTSKSSAGYEPGGGGSGGSGGVFGSDKAGGVGAKGRAWSRIYV